MFPTAALRISATRFIGGMMDDFLCTCFTPSVIALFLGLVEEQVNLVCLRVAPSRVLRKLC